MFNAESDDIDILHTMKAEERKPYASMKIKRKEPGVQTGSIRNNQRTVNGNFTSSQQNVQKKDSLFTSINPQKQNSYKIKTSKNHDNRNTCQPDYGKGSVNTAKNSNYDFVQKNYATHGGSYNFQPVPHRNSSQEIDENMLIDEKSETMYFIKSLNEDELKRMAEIETQKANAMNLLHKQHYIQSGTHNYNRRSVDTRPIPSCNSPNYPLILQNGNTKSRKDIVATKIELAQKCKQIEDFERQILPQRKTIGAVDQHQKKDRRNASRAKTRVINNNPHTISLGNSEVYFNNGQLRHSAVEFQGGNKGQQLSRNMNKTINMRNYHKIKGTLDENLNNSALVPHGSQFDRGNARLYKNLNIGEKYSIIRKAK